MDNRPPRSKVARTEWRALPATGAGFGLPELSGFGPSCISSSGETWEPWSISVVPPGRTTSPTLTSHFVAGFFPGSLRDTEEVETGRSRGHCLDAGPPDWEVGDTAGLETCATASRALNPSRRSVNHLRVPGFHLHRSNRLESLAGTLGLLMRTPLSSPFQPETVVVQSQGMARWLKLELAASLGIAANLRFPFPRAFAHELFRALDLTVDARPSFDPELLVWRIFQLLPEAATLPGFGSVARYLADGDARKRFQLAGRLARLIDQYLVFRPDLIDAWDANSADWAERFGADPRDEWQARLWHLIGQGWANGHPASWHREFLRRAQAGTLPVKRLPERVSVFGVSSLPPFHLDLFAALATVAHVHVFLLQPTEHYWGDVRSRREQALLRRRTAAESAGPPHEEGHRLVASLGRTGREMLDLLLDRDIHDEAEDFTDPLAPLVIRHSSFAAAAPLLAHLQSAMLALRQRAVGEPRRVLAVADDSIRVHSCHSAMREVEVLRDHLLAWLNDDPTLQPRDIVVMVPDLETYAPLIEAVLSLPETPSQFIPFSIADRSPRAGGLGAALWQALELIGGMFGASEVFSLLERDAVRRRFGLDEDDVELCRDWLRAAEIRWGRDAAHTAEHGVDETNSWKAGLSRLLMSYALGGDDEVVVCGVARSVEMDGGDADCLRGFCLFAETLLRFSEQSMQPAEPVEWARRLDVFSAALLDAGAADVAGETETLRTAIATLRDAGKWAGCREPIGLNVVMEHLGGVLDEDRRGRGFLHGGVTVCGLKPMRSIPFKVVCLMGMNHGVFPRQSAPLAFDLAANRRRAGDSSPRDDDRHLFLETLLSARSRIHISHVGQSQRDGKDIPPSVVVSELLDHLDHELELPGGVSIGKELVVKHRLQAFSPDYFKGGRLCSFSAANRAAAEALAGPRSEPLPFARSGEAAAQRQGRAAHLACPTESQSADQPVRADETMASFGSPSHHGAGWKPALPSSPIAPADDDGQRVDLAALVRFFKNPARHFLEHRLSMRLSRAEESVADEERFDIDGLENHLLIEAGIKARRAKPSSESPWTFAAAAGRLPSGSLQAPEVKRIEQDTETFWLRCKDHFGSESRRTPVEFTSASGLVVDGSVEVFGDAVVLAKYSKMDGQPGLLLEAWISLLLAVTKDAAVKRAVVVLRDETFQILRPDSPRMVLENLLSVYRRGLDGVLPFACKSSFAYAMKTSAKVKVEAEREHQCMQAARGAWGSGFRPENAPAPESEDEAMRMAFAGQDLPAWPEFGAVSLEVFGPMLEGMEELPE